MHADLSRITFQPERHYSAVVAQQGRVQLDADVNEQAAIQLHQARTATVDLVGRHAGPEGAVGFEIHLVGSSGELDTLTIGGGRYYVDGIQVDADRPRAGIPVPDDGAEGSAEGGAQAREEPAEWTYWDQPGAHLDRENPADRLPTGYPYLVYLRVFERLVTAAEDPRLREVALGAATPDTTARVKVVWQVLPLPAGELGLDAEAGPDEARAAFRRWADEEAAHRSALAARAERPARADEDPCLVGPDARFRGLENQLYRVEVHRGGPAGEATFKWSRENGSVTFPVDEVDGSWLRLGSLGADDKLSLDVGDRVELLDTAAADRQAALPLARVEELDLPGRRVRLSAEPPASVGRRPDLHPYLRRWDHSGGGRGEARLREGALPVEEGRWLPLEDGVEVYFAAGGGYRTGEHWLVPARTATGGVEWPADAGHRPLLRGPLGVTPHLAPLAWVWGEGSEPDLRDSFGPLATPVPAASAAELAAERAAAEETRAAAEAAGAE